MDSSISMHDHWISSDLKPWFLSGKQMLLKVEKILWFVIKCLILKQTALVYFQNFFIWNAAQIGYQYIFVCKIVANSTLR